MATSALVLDVAVTTGRGALDTLGSDYDGLADELDIPLTGRRPWLSAWIAAYPGYEPWVVGAWDSNRLVGVCSLAHRRVDEREEVVALGHGRNDRTRILAADDDVARVLADRVALALRQSEHPWSLRIEQLPTTDLVASALVAEMPEMSLLPGGSVPGVDFSQQARPDAHFSRNMHRQLQKCRNRIAHDGLRASTTFTRVQHTLWEHLDEIEEAHRARDHDVGRMSDIDDPAGRQLWRGLIAAHIERDQVEIAMMRLDDVLAAYVVSFRDRSTYRVFDGRFVTRWARYSPGRLLEAETLVHAMSTGGFEHLDWMNSIAPDKLISANTLEPTVHLVGCSTGP